MGRGLASVSIIQASLSGYAYTGSIPILLAGFLSLQQLPPYHSTHARLVEASIFERRVFMWVLQLSRMALLRGNTLTRPGSLCARLRSTDAQPGLSHFCDKRAASAGRLLFLRAFLLVIIIQIIHRDAQELGGLRQCRTCRIVGGIIYHTASHTKRNICPSRELADAYILLPQNLLHAQPKRHNDTSLLILFHDYRGKEKKNKSMCFSTLDFLYSF